MNDLVMRAQKEAETEAATPEQLVQILEREIVARRSHRPWTSRNRATILVVGVLFIVIGAGVALLVLDQMLADLRQNGGAPQSSTTPARTNF
jgi:hypothetical protein